MPRKYIKKTITQYTLENLQLAINDVRNKKLSLWQAAKKYSIPKSTLFKYVKLETELKETKRGRHAVFNVDQETQFEQNILEYCRTFNRITTTHIRKMAYQFAEDNKLKHNFDRNAQMAGKDWYHSFMSRHPSIQLRNNSRTKIDSKSTADDMEVTSFFDSFRKLLNSYQFGPSSIFNIDEFGFDSNSKLLSTNELRNSERNDVTTTLVCTMSPNGIYVPPMIIYNKNQFVNLDLLLKNDSITTVSDSGWINQQIFIDYLNHFRSFVKPTKLEPVLIVLNRNENQINLKATEIFRENGIHILLLPSGTVQPLDLIFFNGLKSVYDNEYEFYSKKLITQDLVTELFIKAFSTVVIPENAISGFRETGIYPTDPGKLKYYLEYVREVNTVQNQFEVSIKDETLAEETDIKVKIETELL